MGRSYPQLHLMNCLIEGPAGDEDDPQNERGDDPVFVGAVRGADVLGLQEAQLGDAVGRRLLVVDEEVVQREPRSDYCEAREPDDDER